MPFTARRATMPATALLLAVLLLPLAAASAAAVGNADLVQIANGYRANAGLGPLSLHATIERITVERAEQIADAEVLSHDFGYLKRRFDEEGICWTAFGEIVASNRSGDYGSFGEQWFNSGPHHDVMLGDYTHAGGARAQGASGRYYAAMVFVKLCRATAPASPTGFTDIAGSMFAADIAWLVENEITGGCAASRFCPRDPVTREQMASFLRRGLRLPASSRDYFADDATSVHQDAINRTAAAAISAGCANQRYCPRSPVTRGQMASFLVRALGLPAATRDWFSDDNGTIHEGAINRLAEAGVTGGCSVGRFCPQSQVTREQMAGFLARAIGD